jgi:protein-tyrosine-phosphatase
MTRDPQIEQHLSIVVDALINHTHGAIPRQEIETLVDDIYDEMAPTATVENFLPVFVGRAALERLQEELPQAEAELRQRPEVLIVCQQNAGRSQAAAALFRHYAPGLLFVESAGLAPADRLQPAVLEVLAAHGVHLIDEAKALRPEMLERADHVIVLGDIDLDGVRWDLPQLEESSPGQVADVMQRIDGLVREALGEWFPDLELAEPVMQGASDPV